MIILISGASHTGKTVLAHRLMTRLSVPYLSIDHLKMGMIKSGYTSLTAYDDEAMTAYLWPILRGMISTAVQNGQDMIIEGCYIPFDWQSYFGEDEKSVMKYYCLVMSDTYIKKHFECIKAHANVIEKRLDDSCFTIEKCLKENAFYDSECKKHGLDIVRINDKYDVDVDV